MTTGIVHRFDCRVYRLAAVKKAAYKFGGEYDVNISIASAGEIIVTLRPRTLGLVGSSARSATSFEQEVLDQDLRESLAEETAALRNVLIVQAFSETSLLDPVGETANADEDPVGMRHQDASPHRRGESL